MENASKALLMAAGVLIGTLILSLAVFLFTSFRASANQTIKTMEEEEIAQFNSYYLGFDGRNDLTYYDVWSIINRVRENNKKYEGESENSYGISIELDGKKLTNNQIDTFGIKDISDLSKEERRDFGRKT